MTLDEAIAHAREVAEEQRKACDLSWVWDNPDNIKKCAKEHDQLAEWLEELKFLKQWKLGIMDSFCKYDASSFEELIANARNKAIDDFVNVCKDNTVCQTFGLRQCDIEKIATQLKGGDYYK